MGNFHEHLEEKSLSPSGDIGRNGLAAHFVQ
jgi:hypothetical protein